MMNEKDFFKLHNGSDVRGVAVDGVAGEPVTLTAEAVNRIASGFVKFLTDKLGKAPDALKVTIGNDSRISAQEIKHAACKALVAHGVHVVDCGLASTPAMFMSIVYPETAFDGSCMITASHLPFNRNGLKFFAADGGLDKPDITRILELAEGYAQDDGFAEVSRESEADKTEQCPDRRPDLHISYIGLFCLPGIF